MKEITLSQGYIALVDDEDYTRVSQHRWYAGNCAGKIYPRSSAGKKNKKMYLHRFLMQPPPGLEVDHINGNTLDNTRKNLRICTQAENRRNYDGNNSKSGYKGVMGKNSKWQARIKLDRKEIYLGVFATKELAAQAYNRAAHIYHGEFARLNVIGGMNGNG